MLTNYQNCNITPFKNMCISYKCVYTVNSIYFSPNQSQGPHVVLCTSQPTDVSTFVILCKYSHNGSMRWNLTRNWCRHKAVVNTIVKVNSTSEVDCCPYSQVGRGRYRAPPGNIHLLFIKLLRHCPCCVVSSSLAHK